MTLTLERRMIVSWLKQGRWSMSRATYVWVHRGHSDGVHMICKETQYPGETSVVDSTVDDKSLVTLLNLILFSIIKEEQQVLL